MKDTTTGIISTTLTNGAKVKLKRTKTDIFVMSGRRPHAKTQKIAFSREAMFWFLNSFLELNVSPEEWALKCKRHKKK